MSLWIDSNAALEEFCIRCSGRQVVAVDTEFMWTSTYLPRLALVQLGWDEENCALVDVLAVTETDCFRKLLENSGVCKVFHEAASDLPILHQWCGAVPENIFDTRLAAGFCGLTQGCSLGKLVEHFTGVRLDKSETRSDWLQRPLTSEQLAYADGDVKELPRLRDCLEKEVRACGNWELFLQEMAVFSGEDYYETLAPEDYWRKLAGDHLDGRHLAVLREVACWRENTARSLNKARPRILSDSQMMEVVHILPKKTEELGKVTKFWGKMIKAYGEDILQAVTRGMETPPEQFPRRDRCSLDYEVMKKRTNDVVKIVREVSDRRKIDPGLLGSRKDAVAFVKAWDVNGTGEGCRLMTAWRRQLLAEKLQALGSAWNR